MLKQFVYVQMVKMDFLVLDGYLHYLLMPQKVKPFLGSLISKVIHLVVILHQQEMEIVQRLVLAIQLALVWLVRHWFLIGEQVLLLMVKL
jgi:hypothetical protein